ncbi:uncharacterized protein LOC130122817 isoform X2 [Lampris incognitus]|uniref:uncharacterized protein LOC130122817 isoform X2 n=1 Tax=Lampris incognitus TaxID=2546036 RepID=UPI0024B4A7C6|nr:uncharacterized protein LOC130122817 isoform X2 [Lampris incognitus]
MTDPQNQTEPLIRHPSRDTINAGAPTARSSSRAFMGAGLAVLACLLISAQALTAYFLFSQRDDIKSLEDQQQNLKVDMRRGRVAAMPMQMHVPLGFMTKLADVSAHEDGSTAAPGDDAASQLVTSCQLEAAGLRTGPVPSFKPRCDEQGLYHATQCWIRSCWCVDIASGKEIPRSGEHGCKQSTVNGAHLSRVMAAPAVAQLSGLPDE